MYSTIKIHFDLLPLSCHCDKGEQNGDDGFPIHIHFVFILSS